MRHEPTEVLRDSRPPSQQGVHSGASLTGADSQAAREYCAHDARLFGCTQLVTVVLDNIPMVNPFRLDMGPVAYQAAYDAIRAALDKELQPGRDGNHWVVIADASANASIVAPTPQSELQAITSDQDSSPAKRLRAEAGDGSSAVATSSQPPATTTRRLTNSEAGDNGAIGEVSELDDGHPVMLSNST